MLHGPKSTQRRAKSLRSEMSLPEVLLWQALRTRPGGLKFRRQHPAGRYVLDFFCASLRLAVEIDGEAHDRTGRPKHDEGRDVWLGAHDVRVLRIPATDVLTNLEGVIQHILAEATSTGRIPLHHAMPTARFTSRLRCCDVPPAHRCSQLYPPPLAGED